MHAQDRERRLIHAATVATMLGFVATAIPAVEEQPVRAQEALTTAESPSIVLILTDDQRADTMRYMPIVRRVIGQRGITFSNAYVPNPVCCPSRTSILTGTYSHTTGVYTNRWPNGGFRRFDDSSTIATWLHDAGYRTALFGKYLNQYRRTTYLPPGWDRWFATYGGQGSYYDYTAVSDGRMLTFESDLSDYGQTVLRRGAVSFIRSTPSSQPLFLYWATHAPHWPAIPHPMDRDAFAALDAWRPSSFDEVNVSDKPAWVRRLPRIDARTSAEISEYRLRQIRSLQAVDRAVGDIVEALDETGRLENTLIVFMSDNGMSWGEHRWHRKSVAYEEAIHVPMLVRFDAMIDEPRGDDSLALNIDLAPTFAAVAGVEAAGAEGRSLLPLLRSPDPTNWRDAFLIEHLGEGANASPTFCGIHTERYVLVRYATGEEELYDLLRDPRQLTNRDGRGRWRPLQDRLRADLQELCQPAPPGFSW